MSQFREWVSCDFAAAAVVVALFVFVPIAAYVDYRDVYGEFAELKLFVFGALGMSAAFGLYVGRGRRVLALVPGLVAGLSGIALYLYLPAPALNVAPEAPSGYLWFVVFLVGATPGMLLYWLLRRLRGDSGASRRHG
jgi:di/tricarboxylate transporter